MTMTDLDTRPDELAMVVPSTDGPCSREEAEQLLHEMYQTAERFVWIVKEIVRRKAWTSLGYSSAQAMLLSEDDDGRQLKNPKTGKPYSRAHVYRMVQAATTAVEIEQRTGLTSGEIEVSPKALQQLRARNIEFSTLVDEISQRVEEEGAVDAVAVQRITDEAVSRATGAAAPTAAEQDRPDSARPGGGDSVNQPSAQSSSDVDEDLEDGDERSGSGGGEGKPRPTEGGENTDDYDDYDRGDDEQAGTQRSNSVPVPSDDEIRDAQRFTDFQTTLRAYNMLVESKLPNLKWIQSELPDVLDHADPQEQDELAEELDDLRLHLEHIPEWVSAIDDIMGALNAEAERR